MYTGKTTESAVSVTLTVNNLDEGTYIARVPYKALDLDNIVSDIANGHPGIDPYVINHAAELIKEQILKYIKEGKAVNILDIVTVSIAPKTVVPRSSPQIADLPSLRLKFKASKATKEALAAVKPSSFMVKTNEPAIRRVLSLKDGSDKGVLYRGYAARVEGENLKVTGESSGVFLVPAGAEGAPERDESAWVPAVDSSYLPRNFPKTLEFNIPEEAQEGASYFVAVRTRYSRAGRLRKSPVTGFSSQMVVIQG